MKNIGTLAVIAGIAGAYIHNLEDGGNKLFSKWREEFKEDWRKTFTMPRKKKKRIRRELREQIPFLFQINTPGAL
jgi:hypothetical protein